MSEFDKTENATEGDRVVLVYATAPSREVAEAIGRPLVEAGLAACVNIIPGMVSIYRWDGSIATDAEVVVLVKTRRTLAPRVMAEIGARHPYTTPALLVLPVSGGSPAFLDWIERETAASAEVGATISSSSGSGC